MDKEFASFSVNDYIVNVPKNQAKKCQENIDAILCYAGLSDYKINIIRSETKSIYYNKEIIDCHFTKNEMYFYIQIVSLENKIHQIFIGSRLNKEFTEQLNKIETKKNMSLNSIHTKTFNKPLENLLKLISTFDSEY